jgi:hypothetical protein
MSTATPAQHRTVTVPAPRSPSDPELQDAPRPAAPQEPVSIFGRHAWLVPVTGIACVVAIFVSMVLLTWAAGGGTPFDR